MSDDLDLVTVTFDLTINGLTFENVAAAVVVDLGASALRQRFGSLVIEIPGYGHYVFSGQLILAARLRETGGKSPQAVLDRVRAALKAMYPLAE